MTVMTSHPEADRAVAAVLRKQGGLITRAQAMAAGWTEGTLRNRARPGGPWRMVLPPRHPPQAAALPAHHPRTASFPQQNPSPPSCRAISRNDSEHHVLGIPTTFCQDKGDRKSTRLNS